MSRAANTGGNITVTVDSGNVDLKTGSTVRSNSAPAAQSRSRRRARTPPTSTAPVESVGSITGTGGRSAPAAGRSPSSPAADSPSATTAWSAAAARIRAPISSICRVATLASTAWSIDRPRPRASQQSGRSLQPAGPGHLPGGFRSTFFTACVEVSVRHQGAHRRQITTGRSMSTRGKGVAPAGAAGSIFTRGRTSPSWAW